MNVSEHRQRWRAEWRENGRKQRQSFATEREARMFAALAEANTPELARRFVRREVDASALVFPSSVPAAPAGGHRRRNGRPDAAAAATDGGATSTTLIPAPVRPGDLVLFKPFARQVLEQRTGITERTRQDDLRTLEHHVLPYWNADDLTLGAFRHQDRTDRAGHRIGPDGKVLSISNWILWLEKREGFTNRGRPSGRTLQPKTVANIHGLLSMILQAAVDDDDRLLDRNPCARSVLPEQQREERIYLEPAQVAALLHAIDPHFRTLLLFLLLTGVRWGEAAGLAVKHVHLSPATGHPYVSIRLAWRRLLGGVMALGRVKSKCSIRDIPIPPELVPLLHALIAGRGPDEPVFTMRGGGRLHHSNFRDRFLIPAVLAAGLPAATRAHAFRHTHVAWLIAAKVPMLAISRRLGHHDEYFTSKRYGHLLDRIGTEVLTALSASLVGLPLGGDSSTTSAAAARGGPAGEAERPGILAVPTPVLPSDLELTAAERPDLYPLDPHDAALPEHEEDDDAAEDLAA